MLTVLITGSVAARKQRLCSSQKPLTAACNKMRSSAAAQDRQLREEWRERDQVSATSSVCLLVLVPEPEVVLQLRPSQTRFILCLSW